MDRNWEVTQNESGKNNSPVMNNGLKNFLIDIDGTVGEDIPNEEPERMLLAEVYKDALEKINKWFAEGHIITFFTARNEEHRSVTEEWLNNSGFHYHGLIMNKPRGGNYHVIDNHMVKATKFNGKFTEFVEKEVTIKVFED
jgi:uncharacterized HAD superfamily protein